jgi:hypothetical protein
MMSVILPFEPVTVCPPCRQARRELKPAACLVITTGTAQLRGAPGTAATGGLVPRRAAPARTATAT